MKTYMINGRGTAGWRIDVVHDDVENQPTGFEFLQSYVAFVNKKEDADLIVKLLNEHEKSGTS